MVTANTVVTNTATTTATASSNLRAFGTTSSNIPTSALGVAQDLLRSKGISGVYKGLGATLARFVCTTEIFKLHKLHV